MNTNTYPNQPGFKVAGPSEIAAANVAEDAATVRGEVIAALERYGAMTADECAAILKRSILTVRPRFSELRTAGRLVDTGTRRKNSSGHSASVWRLAGVLQQAELI